LEHGTTYPVENPSNLEEKGRQALRLSPPPPFIDGLAAETTTEAPQELKKKFRSMRGVKLKGKARYDTPDPTVSSTIAISRHKSAPGKKGQEDEKEIESV